MKVIVASFNQEKALVRAFSVITNLRMELFEALIVRGVSSVVFRQHRKKSRRSPHGEKERAELSGANQDIGDKLIEVVGLENCLHMGQVSCDWWRRVT